MNHPLIGFTPSTGMALFVGVADGWTGWQCSGIEAARMVVVV
jgi:hypothetical protein